MRSAMIRRFAIRNPIPKAKRIRCSSTWRDMGNSLPGSGIRDPGFGGSSGFRARSGSALEIRIEAHAATSFVGALRSEQDAVTAWDEALRVIGWIAAHHTDRQCLGDVFRDGEELGHRFERLAEVILIESRHDDALPAIGQFVDHGWQLLIEELSFVDADDLSIVLDQFEQRV